ncbi:CoA transferase [Bradyrhizobium cosmicum]|uniref:CoA transferase n=1 Tax=Bradyrhizobium cosmicum TaxID=1404864 RepID=UPI0039657C5A
MSRQPLTGVRVLEIADAASGGFCGRQVSQWGAEVVMLELPAGGALRSLGPSGCLPPICPRPSRAAPRTASHPTPISRRILFAESSPRNGSGSKTGCK